MGIERTLVEGDTFQIFKIIKDSGFRPTQNNVYAETINRYVQEMIDGTFEWSKISKGDLIRVTSVDGGAIEHGHHRLIAAFIASSLTKRPLYGTKNAIIPEDALIETGKVGGETDNWRGMGVLKGLKPGEVRYGAEAKAELGALRKEMLRRDEEMRLLDPGARSQPRIPGRDVVPLPTKQSAELRGMALDRALKQMFETYDGDWQVIIEARRLESGR